MIHLIAGKKRGAEVVRIAVEDGTRLEHCWGHLPSKGEHEAGDSRADFAGVMVHVDQERVEENGSGEGGSLHHWNANPWIGIASGSPLIWEEGDSG